MKRNKNKNKNSEPKSKVHFNYDGYFQHSKQIKYFNFFLFSQKILKINNKSMKQKQII